MNLSKTCLFVLQDDHWLRSLTHKSRHAPNVALSSASAKFWEAVYKLCLGPFAPKNLLPESRLKDVGRDVPILRLVVEW
jgi:hypothetical protein